MYTRCPSGEVLFNEACWSNFNAYHPPTMNNSFFPMSGTLAQMKMKTGREDDCYDFPIFSSNLFLFFSTCNII